MVRRFGDPTRLLDDCKKQVKALPFPQRQNREQLMKYFKSLSEILDQLESLVNEHSMEFPQLQSEIYSHSCHSEIVRLLPEFIKNYTFQYLHFSYSSLNQLLTGYGYHRIKNNLICRLTKRLTVRMQHIEDSTCIVDYSSFCQQYFQICFRSPMIM